MKAALLYLAMILVAYCIVGKIEHSTIVPKFHNVAMNPEGCKLDPSDIQCTSEFYR